MTKRNLHSCVTEVCDEVRPTEAPTIGEYLWAKLGTREFGRLLDGMNGRARTRRS